MSQKTLYRRLAIAAGCVLLVLLFLAPGASFEVPFWYTQGDTLKATITKQWLTFGKIRFNRDGRATADTLTVTAIIGSTQLRDTASFSGTSTRLAIYVPGGKSTDYYTVSVRFTTDTVPDSTDDPPIAWAKTDSVILLRPAGGRSGLKVSLHRDR